MKRTTLAIGVAALCCGLSTAQWLGDDFNSNTLTGWTLDRGAWTATTMRAHSDSTSTWQYATRTDVVATHCSAECDVYHSGNGLDFAGVAIRVNDPTGSTLGRDLVMAKLQGSSGLTQMWLYTFDAGGANTNPSVSAPSSQSGRVRLTAIGQRIVAEWDTDMDGVFDRTITTMSTFPVSAGPVGLCGYSSGICDDFKAYNAAILPAVSATPTPGSSMLYDLGGPANARYLGAISLGNSGFPVSASRRVPLDVDNLFILSINNAFGPLFGALDGSGVGGMAIQIPNIPALTGLAFYAGFVGFDNTGLVAISNDARTVIQ